MDRKFHQEVSTRVVKAVESNDQDVSGLMGMRGGNEPDLLPEGVYPHHLTLEELRWFPRYLCDGVICSGYQLPDHMMYWGWTAAFIKGGWYQREQLDHPLPREFLRDIVLLVNQSFWTDWEMDVMQLRTQKIRSDPLGHQTQSRFNPPMSIEEWLSNRLPDMMAYYRITIKLGFSLLEGLIRRHCDDLDPRGRLTTSDSTYKTYLLPWNDADDPCGEDVKYYDELRLWMNEEAEPETRETLETIHDLEQPDYDVPSYKEVLENIIDSDDLDVSGSEGFLQILKNLRNTDLHGQENAEKIFSSVIVTLCCTVFWDAISRDPFQSHRDGLLNSIGQQNWHRESGAGPKHELDAEVYYPWYNDVHSPHESDFPE